MRYPISDRAKRFVRDRATAVMRYTCRIERVIPPTYDPGTLIASPGDRTTVYEGVCRIWEVSGGSPVMLGDTDLIVQSTNLSIPWDVSVLPRRNDEVLILTAPGEDPVTIGKRFQIQTSAKAGELRATRRFEVTAMEKSS